MSLLLSVQSLSKSHGSQNLFTDISFSVKEKERIGFVGPNGAGKSTLLKIIAGLEKQDSGSISKRQGLKIASAEQTSEFGKHSVKEVLLSSCSQEDREDAEYRAKILLDKANISWDCPDVSVLSGGEKKKLDIIRVFMQSPDLIFLDEPTNHLDLEAILWLEQFLLKERPSCVLVSHDRYFLRNVCTKIIELNPCYPNGVFSCDEGWSAFLERKEAFLEGQQRQQRTLASTVREEVEWMRKSPKARTTKSKARMQKAEDLIDQLQGLRQRNAQKSVEVDFSASERETRHLIVTNNLGKSLGGKSLFKGVTVKISPGTRLGVVGKNGTGKTTLLKILAGQVQQDMGTVKYAQDLRLVYFDQHREQIDPSNTLKEALSPEGDFVRFRGQEIHVSGWAKKFLFPPNKLNLPVHALSGGERARILIARLMLQPADVLFLDEPTNDLDIDTLEVMQQSLLEFPGAVVLITHDRYLMDQICTQILGLGSQEEPTIFAGYAQWEKSNESSLLKKEERKEPSVKSVVKAKKLSYHEQKELDGMEKAILLAEQNLAVFHEKQAKGESSPDFYKKMHEAQEAVDLLYERWQVLLDKV